MRLSGVQFGAPCHPRTRPIEEGAGACTSESVPRASCLPRAAVRAGIARERMAFSLSLQDLGGRVARQRRAIPDAGAPSRNARRETTCVQRPEAESSPSGARRRQSTHRFHDSGLVLTWQAAESMSERAERLRERNTSNVEGESARGASVVVAQRRDATRRETLKSEQCRFRRPCLCECAKWISELFVV